MIPDFSRMGRLLGPPTILTFDATFISIRRPFPLAYRNTKRVVIEAVAGGGGGGAAVASTASNCSIGGGAQGGAYGVVVVDRPQVIHYIIGAGGTAGTGTSNGGSGGATQVFVDFATALNVAGGLGGEELANGSSAAVLMHGTSGAAGSASLGIGAANNCSFRVGGMSAGNAERQSGTVAVAGRGGNSRLGIGGAGRLSSGAGETAASGYGGGGGGGAAFNGDGAVDGGAGAPGVVIIWELGE